MSIEELGNGGGVGQPEKRATFPAPIDDNDPEVLRRRRENAPVSSGNIISQEEAYERLASDPESPESKTILSAQIGSIQEKFADRTYDTSAYNRAVVWLYLELNERNPYWRERLADALFDASVTASQAGDEESAKTYANQLTEGEYEERCY